MSLPVQLNWVLLSALLLALLWLPYAAALRRERCFGFNRAYLGLAPLLAAGLPLLPAGWWAWSAVPLQSAGVAGATQWLPVLRLSAAGSSAGFEIGRWAGWLPIIYAAGVVGQLGRLGWQLGQLRQHLSRSPRTRYAGYTLVLGATPGTISSFGRWIFWHDSAGPATTANPLFRHELAHVRRRHTWDRLGLALLQAALWFNPFVYLFSRALALTQEFQADADAAVLAGPVPTPTLPYAAVLARYAAARYGAGPGLSLAHSLTHSPLLTRLAMLKNHLPVRRWKQALVLPVLAVALLVVGCERQSAPPNNTTAAADNATAAADNATAAADNATAAADNANSNALKLLPPPPAPGPAANPLETPEQNAEYPGGIGRFMGDLEKVIRYPDIAKTQHLQGKIFLGFVVGVDGHIYDVIVKKPLFTPPAQAAAARALEAEALRAVRSLTATWTPGRDGGHPVAASFTLPVQFAL